jgi:hypothetical protein
MPPPLIPQPIVNDSPSLRKEIEEMERRNASQREQAGAIMQEIEDKEVRQALGLDIEFDVSKIITQGIIEKRGIKIIEPIEAADGNPGSPGLWLDMHTLSKEEDIMSEQLVMNAYEALGGGIKLSKPYYEAKATAMLAMAITRFNNKLFPVPPTDPAKRKSPEFETAWKGKQELFNIILSFPSHLADNLSFVYVNLSKADVLVEGADQKKSSRP